jgi:hypothetical protein
MAATPGVKGSIERNMSSWGKSAGAVACHQISWLLIQIARLISCRQNLPDGEPQEAQQPPALEPLWVLISIKAGGSRRGRGSWDTWSWALRDSRLLGLGQLQPSHDGLWWLLSIWWAS